MLTRLVKKLRQTPLATLYLKYKEIRNRIHKYRVLKWIYPRLYKKYAQEPVDENKIIFIEIRHPEVTNSFKVLYDELTTKYDFTIHTHFLRNSFVTRKEYVQRCKDMIQDVATAKYVFLNEGSNVFSSLKIRPETIVTQTWHGCGAFKKFGFSTADLIFGDNRKEMTKFPFNKNYTHVTVSSPEVVWAYEEAMNLKKRKGIVKATGVSRTDVFYDPEFIQNAFKKLHGLMPESVGKKVILYAPTFRGRVAKAESPDMLSIPMFYEHLKDDYVLIIKHHPVVKKPPVIDGMYQEFAQDFTEAMSIEELLCVSDICISDYSSLVFEYALFERPMIFFSYDLDEYFDWRGFYYDYYELAPGPVLTTNLDMIDYIKNIDTRFDKQRVVDFKNKFMSSCDGHATERIMDMVFGNALESHQREEVLPYEYHMIPNCKQLYSKKQQKLETLKEYKESCNKKYLAAAETSVKENTFVLLSNKNTDPVLDKMKKQLEEKGVSVKLLSASFKNEKLDDVVKEMATANYIVLSGKCELVNILDIREETKVVQLWNQSASLMKYDYASKKVIGGLEKEYLDIAPLHYNYDLVSVASKELVEDTKEAMNVTKEQAVQPLGSAVTDLLYDKEFKEKAQKKLYKVFPKAKEKKVIFYLPTHRWSETRPKKIVFVDTQWMNEYLSKDYVMVYYDTHREDYIRGLKKRQEDHYAQLEYYQRFLRDLTKKMSILELMAAADVMITDYWSEAYSFAATGKPVFFYAPDYHTYFTEGDLYRSYEAEVPGPVYTNGRELARAVADLGHYNYEQYQKVKDTYLNQCDGHSIERIVNYLLDNQSDTSK
jgi:CDP-glycerol glycerophosphotransferase (TagB/SpsB family)